MSQFGAISKLLMASLVLLVGVTWAEAPDIPTLEQEPEFTPGLSNTVSWSDESASGATEYFVGASTDSVFPEPQELDLSSGWISGTTHTFQDVLEDGLTYYYRVRSRNVDLEMSEWSEEMVVSTQDASGPDPVTDLAAVGRYEYVRLNWSQVEDAGIGFAYYRVYRSEAAGELGARIDEGDETVTVGYSPDENVQVDITYWYTVRPVDQFGNETEEGNNQDDATLLVLGDPDVEFVWPPTYYVTEAEEIDVNGIFYNTLAIDINGRPARMTLDPAFGEFDLNDIPLEMGLNLIIADGTGTFGSTESDTVYVFRLPEGDPVVTITAPEDQSYLEIGAVDVIGEVENVGFLWINGQLTEIAFTPDFSSGTFTVVDFPLPEYGEYVIQGIGAGCPLPGELEDRVDTTEVTVYVIAPDPLAVEITSPPDQYITDQGTVNVEGTFGGAWKVEVNGQLAELDQNTFAFNGLPLEMGPNTITAVATGADMATVEDVITVYRIPDITEPPTVEITSPSDGDVTNPGSIEVTGTATNAGWVTVGYEGIDEVMAFYDFIVGTWNVTVDLPAPYAEVTLIATAYGADQNATDQVTIYVISGTDPPTIQITYPEDGATLTGSPVLLTGTTENVGWVEVNGALAEFDGTTFSLLVVLVDGSNTIEAVGYGTEDQTATDTITIWFNEECAGDPGSITITTPADGDMTQAETIDVLGESHCLVSVDVNGTPAEFDIENGSWNLTALPLNMGANTITATGTNWDGGTVTATVTVYRLEDPSITITSPADSTVFEFEDSLITVQGTSTGLISVQVNGVDATLQAATGEWTATGVDLVVGTNTITATGIGMTTVTATITVTRLDDLGSAEFHAIFTPNGDGYNDEVSIPVDGQGSSAIIYTRDGQEVIKLESAEEFMEGWFIQWDGNDDKGKLVMSGVYIYQVDNNGDKNTGTIVVAR